MVIDLVMVQERQVWGRMVILVTQIVVLVVINLMVVLVYLLWCSC